MKKIVLILLICLIFAGTVIVCFKGFNVGLPYKSNINISVYVGKKIEDKDMQEITKEVFKGKQAIVQKVELFEDMISITTEEMSEEELNEKKTELINKLNEKYEKEIKDEEIEIVHNPKVKLSSLIKRYILPFGISTIAIVIYQMIRFKKLGATKTLLTTIIVLMLIGLTYTSLIAITRIPINKLIIPIGMAIYVITIIVLNMKYEKKLEENK
ncbi:MAG TPA: hypothetical protein OIM50_02690 [Clostridiaceae bacterium]|jgi:preprotein translocase subunit SecF|nr:hypothetical protein [Clostridia bacterium]HJJ09196.1 hypothetical protein [Clostridiaceae bacterium]